MCRPPGISKNSRIGRGFPSCQPLKSSITLVPKQALLVSNENGFGAMPLVLIFLLNYGHRNITSCIAVMCRLLKQEQSHFKSLKVAQSGADCPRLP